MGQAAPVTLFSAHPFVGHSRIQKFQDVFDYMITITRFLIGNFIEKYMAAVCEWTAARRKRNRCTSHFPKPFGRETPDLTCPAVPKSFFAYFGNLPYNIRERERYACPESEGRARGDAARKRLRGQNSFSYYMKGCVADGSYEIQGAWL